jgi:hypothetical protein
MPVLSEETFLRILFLLVAVVTAGVIAAIRLFSWTRRHPGRLQLAHLFGRVPLRAGDEELRRRAEQLRWLMLVAAACLVATVAAFALTEPGN